MAQRIPLEAQDTMREFHYDPNDESDASDLDSEIDYDMLDSGIRKLWNKYDTSKEKNNKEIYITQQNAGKELKPRVDQILTSPPPAPVKQTVQAPPMDKIGVFSDSESDGFSEDESDHYKIVWTYGTLGIRLQNIHGVAVIKGVNRKINNPALKVARKGDILVAINHQDVTKVYYDNILQMLRTPQFPMTIEFRTPVPGEILQPVVLPFNGNISAGPPPYMSNTAPLQPNYQNFNPPAYGNQQQPFLNPHSSAIPYPVGPTNLMSYPDGLYPNSTPYTEGPYGSNMPPSIPYNHQVTSPVASYGTQAPQHGNLQYTQPPIYPQVSQEEVQSYVPALENHVQQVNVPEDSNPQEYDVVWSTGRLGCGLKENKGVAYIRSIATTDDMCPDVKKYAHEGDILIAVNGIDTSSRPYEIIIGMIKSAPKPITLRFRRPSDNLNSSLRSSTSSTTDYLGSQGRHSVQPVAPVQLGQQTEPMYRHSLPQAAPPQTSPPLNNQQQRYTATWTGGPLGLSFDYAPNRSIVIFSVDSNGAGLSRQVKMGDLLISINGQENLKLPDVRSMVNDGNVPMTFVFENYCDPLNTAVPSLRELRRNQRKGRIGN